MGRGILGYKGGRAGAKVSSGFKICDPSTFFGLYIFSVTFWGEKYLVLGVSEPGQPGFHFHVLIN